jgi:hypothetical protein
MDERCRTIAFLDDRFDPKHRPHHIFRCVISNDLYDNVACLAKENEHGEGRFISALCQTPLLPWLPKYYGCFRHDGERTSYVLLGDLRSGFASPCLADFKIGTRQWGIGASPRTIRQLRTLCNRSTSRGLGLRLVSTTIVRRGTVVESTTKSQNVGISALALLHKIREFLPKSLRKEVKKRIEALRDAYRETVVLFPNMRVYSASVLICYDADDLAKPPRVAMIDFAHGHFDIAEEDADPNDPQFNDGVLVGFQSFLNLFGRFAALRFRLK